MRKLLLLALLLCKCLALIDIKVNLHKKYDENGQYYITDDIVAIATRPNNYDYDDMDGAKRHSLIDDRRNWRKKVLLNPSEMDHKDYDTRRRHDFENPRYFDEPESKPFNGLERQREIELGGYRKRYDDIAAVKSAELAHPSTFM